MATRTIAASLGEVRRLSAALGENITAGTVALLPFPDGTQYVWVTPRNFTTAVVAMIAFNPYLTVVKTTDGGATSTEYSQAAQDASTSTDVILSSLPAPGAAGGYLFVGAHVPFRGVKIDVDAANATASVLTVKYWNGSAWTDISATDGTTSGGASLAQDGNVTWTVPTAWLPTTLVGSSAALAPAGGTSSIAGSGSNYYWTRWEFSGGLDSSTTLNSMYAFNRSTAYMELILNQTLEQSITKGPGGVSAIEIDVNAGSGLIVVNVATAAQTGFLT